MRHFLVVEENAYRLYKKTYFFNETFQKWFSICLVVRACVSAHLHNGALFPPNKAGPVTSKKPGLASHQRRKLDFAQKNAIISY